MRFMRTPFLCAAALAASVVTSIAADMPSKAAPTYTEPSKTNWSGFYVGVHGGWAKGQFNPVGSTLFPIPDKFSEFSPDGAVYGGHAGLNGQVGIVVFGLEVGATWYDLKETISLAPSTCKTHCDAGIQARIKFTADALAKLGFTLGPNLMVYGTGGASWATTEASIVGVDSAPFAGVSANANHVGWAIGGGADWLPFGNHIVIGTRYLYRDLGRQNYTPSAPLGSLSIPVDLTTHEFTVRAAYKF